MSLQIKICGLSTLETLDVALEAGADAVGFVFFPPSPRNISFEQARALEARVKGMARKIALTVNADDALMEEIIDALKPDMLQLHGHETPQRVATIRESFGLPVMKVLPIENSADLAAIASYTGIADRLLFDARRDAAGRPRQTVRLASAGKSQTTNSFHAVGRAACRQRRRGAGDHKGRRRRRFLRCRKRPRREGPPQNPRLHPRSARFA